MMFAVKPEVGLPPDVPQRSSEDLLPIAVMRQDNESDGNDRLPWRFGPVHLWEPSLDEIREACAEVQREWTIGERYRRRVLKPNTRWTVPNVRVGR